MDVGAGRNRHRQSPTTNINTRKAGSSSSIRTIVKPDKKRNESGPLVTAASNHEDADCRGCRPRSRVWSDVNPRDHP